jgi:hypothetical protein
MRFLWIPHDGQPTVFIKQYTDGMQLNKAMFKVSAYCLNNG